MNDSYKVELAKEGVKDIIITLKNQRIRNMKKQMKTAEQILFQHNSSPDKKEHVELLYTSIKSQGVEETLGEFYNLMVRKLGFLLERDPDATEEQVAALDMLRFLTLPEGQND